MRQPGGLTVRSADLGRARPPRWAWLDRVVLDGLSLIIGDEGVGKGTLAAWLIARITRGELVGDLYGTPAVVGILGDEDGWDAVWTPRLHAAGADLDRVKLIERPDGGYVELRGDREALAQTVETEQIRLLYFDALIDHLGLGVDDWRSKHVRDALAPLRSLARAFDVAAVGSMHPNKRGGSFRELVSGSVAFNALSRSSLLLANHPTDDDRRVLVRGKGNLSQMPTAVEFEVVSHRFEANGQVFNVPRAVSFGTSRMTVDELIDGGASRTPAGGSRIAARDVIARELADGQWHEAGPIITECEQQGGYKRAVQRAAADLGVESERSGFPGRVHWRLQPRHADHECSADASVPTVLAGLDAWATSKDSGDSRDTGTGRESLSSAGRESDGYDPDAELARLAQKGLCR
jgi:hypothetical protein